MTFIKNFMDNFKKRKCLTVSFLLGTLVLCCISVIVYNVDTIFPPFPKEVVIEAQREKLSSTCNNYSCIVDWAKRTKKDLHMTEMECKLKKSFAKGLNGTMGLYEDGKIDRSFIVGHYSYFSHKYCHTYCGIDGPFRYYNRYLEVNMQHAWARMRNVKCGTTDSKRKCRWTGYRWYLVYFSYFSIPATFILNFINFTTMRQLFLAYPGTAQQLHFAEIITDALLNVVMGLHDNLYFFDSLDHWRKSCGYYRFSSAFQFVGILQRFLSFLNQAYLTGLVLERLYSLAKPLQYNRITDKKMKERGRRIVLNILLSSIVLFSPFFSFFTFLPTFNYWRKNSDFWKKFAVSINQVMVTTYGVIGFVPYVMQIVAGVSMEKKYRKFIKKRTNDENQKEMKKQERDKQMLLVGTIGLNLVSGIVAGLSYLLYAGPFFTLLGFSKNERPWWRIPIIMFNTVIIFLNGNAAVVIHVMLVRSYRQAFKKTFLGRIMQTASAQQG